MQVPGSFGHESPSFAMYPAITQPELVTTENVDASVLFRFRQVSDGQRRSTDSLLRDSVLFHPSGEDLKISEMIMRNEAVETFEPVTITASSVCLVYDVIFNSITTLVWVTSSLLLQTSMCFRVRFRLAVEA